MWHLIKNNYWRLILLSQRNQEIVLKTGYNAYTFDISVILSRLLKIEPHVLEN